MTRLSESVLAAWAAQAEDDKMELTPKEAITVIRNLQDWLYFSSMNGGTKIQREALDIAVNAIEKQIQSEESFEWCNGCKEYDQEKHCCHRYSKVIRQAFEEMKVVHCIDCQHSEYDEVYKDRYCHYNGKAEVVDDYHFCRDGERSRG